MKKTSRLLLILTVFWTSIAFGAESTPPSGKYEIDSAHSKVGFEIAHLVISTVEGKFNQFAGLITVGEKPEASKVEAKIEVASVDTGNEKRDSDLRSPNFFDAAKFSSMIFESKKVVWQGPELQITGDFTLHGVTKPLTLKGKYLGAVKDQRGNDKIAFQASAEISRKDYGLTWNKLIEAGPVVGDKVTISLKVEAGRSAGTP
ncbi:MAG: YceI family protein [bacterium]